MATEGDEAKWDLVQLEAIRPYASVTVLQCIAEDVNAGLDRLTMELARLKVRSRSRKKSTVIAQGFDAGPSPYESAAEDAYRIRYDCIIFRASGPPSWAASDSDYIESQLLLTTWIARDDLIAVHCDSSLGDSLQRWLDGDPAPHFRRVPEGALHSALLGGEAKNLWLRGIHPKRSTKADSKSISGSKLQDAANPFEDGTYALSSAKAELVPDPDFAALTGIVGTTPGKSRVWLRPCENFNDFAYIVIDLLGTLKRALDVGDLVDKPYPWLASRVYDLSKVSDAFDITSLSPDELLPADGYSDELIDAANVLERAELRVLEPVVGGPGFVVEAGIEGKIGGKLRCQVEQKSRRIRLAFGYEGTPTDEDRIQPVLSALRHSDLLTVHYGTGHAVSGEALWETQMNLSRFPNWRWGDFERWDIRREKPEGKTQQEMHDNIGQSRDRSLFGWVYAEFASHGWLTCDDGANEVADFVSLGDDWSLSLIHVKRAALASANRQTNVTCYEVVASQAMKNIQYLNVGRLLERLAHPLVSSPATWYQGSKVADRSEMIEFLRHRPASAGSKIIIVQPHLRQSVYEKNINSEIENNETRRVRLLDSLLHSARGPATGVGGDLEVYGAQ